MDIWQILMTPFSLLLRTFCQVFNSYGVALILFTVVIKVILFPFTLKGKKSMIQTTMMSSQIQEIQKRCGNDRERYNQELTRFYQENNASPFGGCLWSFIPILIIWPLYAIIRRPLKYLMHLTESATGAVAAALGWTAAHGAEFTPMGTNELILASMMNSGNLNTAATAAGVATTGLFGMFVINFDFFGIDLSQIPNWRVWTTDLSWNSIGLFLLPLISAGLSILSMQVSLKTNQMNQAQQEQNNTSNLTMMIINPLISLWIGYTLPAGLCIYWISNSVLMVLQEIIAGRMLRKDYEAAQKEMEERQRKSKEAEKERRRQAAERKAAAIAAGSKKQQPKSKADSTVRSASQEGLRAYARGRAYDPDRYPVTPYHDPNGPGSEESEEAGPLPVKDAPEDTVERAAPAKEEASQGEFETPYSSESEED